MTDSPLDPTLAERVSHLTMKAQKAAEGLLSGIHRSPHRGASVVFVEHREYRPGDDLRLLDWRAYARSDRHHIKRFEQETHLHAHLILDRSGSMDFSAEDRPTKAAVAATLLAAVALILRGQGDACGYTIFDDELRDTAPPRMRPTHVNALLQALAKPPSRGHKTSLRNAIDHVSKTATRRGLIVLASDLLDVDNDALAALAHLTGRGHEAIVFHVMDTAELSFPYSQPARFLGLEGDGGIESHPEQVRDAYLEELKAFLDRQRNTCIRAGARYHLVDTGTRLEEALAAVLSHSQQPGFR